MSRRLLPVQVCVAPTQPVAVPIQDAIEQPGSESRSFPDVVELFGNARLGAEFGVLNRVRNVGVSARQVTECPLIKGPPVARRPFFVPALRRVHKDCFTETILTTNPFWWATI